MMTEADTCRKYVLPKLIEAGWENDPHSFTEQKTFTDGRIVGSGKRVHRRPQKRADYLLRHTRDFMIAVVEAKASHKSPGDGPGQAKDYAEILGLKFAYATNGHGIIEFDYTTGVEREIETFPSPDELWDRFRAHHGLTDEKTIQRLLTPSNHLTGKSPRYYQEIAINRTVQALLQGKKRILLTMATGTGKTVVAFQICWKLWSSRWNRTGEHRRPKILYLADRNILIDIPKIKSSPPWVMPVGKSSMGKPAKVEKCTLPFIRPLPRMSDGQAFIRNIRRNFSISLSWTSVIGEAHETPVIGVRYWNTLHQPSNSG